ncbi:MAG: Hydroxypyruvate reductase [Candidatus Moanabacter tarae]|uniref:Hydroxypyruvate reductase n=1 Tax=Candidatus Moanibacter tarae TaxID=2200854 RepID=A0A2Z4AEX0_9BACT|nr:MAG: Hydroxypyruvate reductase [Candidatus Moanabacter tarae]|tara:strand:+ start:4299 stop:5297 length:999 start_codon:yes stop_codon:yes gene_type:complete
MFKHKVLVPDHNVRAEGLDLLQDNGIELTVLQSYSRPEKVIDSSKDVAAILARVTQINKEVLTASPKLKIVSRHGVGYDNVAIDECTKLGIAVTTTGDANSEAVSEYAFAQLISLARHLTRAANEVKSGIWKRDNIVGFELYQKTLGIIGLGRIGSRLAKHALGFGMEVLAYDPYPNRCAIDEVDVSLVSFEKLLQKSDFISLHTPLNSETRNLIGKTELDLMKPTAFLVNTARGGLIDEKALFYSLHHRKIGGAALDVFEQEPVPEDYSLLKLDNLMCSPHVAGQTSEALVRTSIAAAQNILCVFRGEPPKNLVNPEVLKNSSRTNWKVNF